MTDLLEAGAELEKVATGSIWAEGPVWIPADRAVRYSDIPNNRILQFSEASGELTVYQENVEFTNGRTLDLDGSVLQCSHGRRRVERDRDGVVENVVDRWAGARLNSPNDVVVKSDGTIWFSDPSYGIQKPTEGHPGELEYGDHYVFRFDPRDGSVVPAVIDVEAPNGLAFSPDESLLYVADSGASPPSGERDPARPGGHSIHVYDVFDGRLCKNGREFAEVSPGVPDGFRVDEHGNVWTSSHDSVQVFDPAGGPLLRIPVPEKIANLCFGGEDGRTIYIVASTSLYRIRTTVRDAAALLRTA
ncbi:SMP-30/gluconolactonase/LRE family protein [Pseudonocardia sp. DSM 110487]|uniref:SMP-30/gluconolactonase/LRE family protein n=1 Tax=Pseudonocardia sp. DSM 110487 TaxID=2865833 RepID=UPI001C696396|nr:SMP-30/gluconolactonase/LRE family protein [Pseudonocardia sp. DSM 110487]QYN36368.1 SMP-30/gluconolactonase/LRE family protein [Pseudonocardia sp. DSM 110487]